MIVQAGVRKFLYVKNEAKKREEKNPARHSFFSACHLTDGALET
jgi:hypothetical protein